MYFGPEVSPAIPPFFFPEQSISPTSTEGTKLLCSERLGLLFDSRNSKAFKRDAYNYYLKGSTRNLHLLS